MQRAVGRDDCQQERGNVASNPQFFLQQVSQGGRLPAFLVALGMDVFVDEILLRERRTKFENRGLDSTKGGCGIGRNLKQGIANVGQKPLYDKPVKPGGFQRATKKHIVSDGCDAGRTEQLRNARPPGPCGRNR